MRFELFDPAAGVDITCRYLPHWFQAGATYFITFRTADSLPTTVLAQWAEKRRQWLESRSINPDNPNWLVTFKLLPASEQAEFHDTFTDAMHQYLDAGYGECLLRRPELAEIVANALRHFDGERYHISDFVVMPNHVHVLMGLLTDHTLADVCYSWKKFTANRINRLVGRSGHFWQGESFDHLVRSPEQFEYLRGYTAANPEKAGLKAGEYVLYQATQ
jgi:REP element-mobilizing transposase RayT